MYSYLIFLCFYVHGLTGPAKRCVLFGELSRVWILENIYYKFRYLFTVLAESVSWCEVLYVKCNINNYQYLF